MDLSSLSARERAVASVLLVQAAERARSAAQPPALAADGVRRLWPDQQFPSDAVIPEYTRMGDEC